MLTGGQWSATPSSTISIENMSSSLFRNQGRVGGKKGLHLTEAKRAAQPTPKDHDPLQQPCVRKDNLSNHCLDADPDKVQNTAHMHQSDTLAGRLDAG